MKKPWIWLRVAAVIFFLFFLVHTLGELLGGEQYRDDRERVVISALKDYRFDAMGTTRSHFDFYMGFNWFLCASMFVIALVTWQLASISRRDPRAARPMSATLCVGAIAFTALCWMYFFIAPLVFFAAAALALAVAVSTA